MSKYRIKIEGKIFEMEIELVGETPIVPAASGPIAPVQKSVTPTPVAARETEVDANAVISPMPGTVNKVFVSQGDMVKKGQTVLILEAMKMENEILASKDGIVTAMNVAEGQTVQGGMILFEIRE